MARQEDRQREIRFRRVLQCADVARQRKFAAIEHMLGQLPVEQRLYRHQFDGRFYAGDRHLPVEQRAHAVAVAYADGYRNGGEGRPGVAVRRGAWALAGVHLPESRAVRTSKSSGSASGVALAPPRA